jgi:hypothetical protein
MAVVVPIISTFDAKGVTRAIKDFQKLDGAGEKSASVLLNTNKAVNTLGKNFAKFGGIAAGVAGVVGGSLVKAAYESQKVMRQTQAIVTATGGAAGLTAKQVSDLAESLSVKTGVDDEAIQTSMNMLLTFKAVRNEAGKGNDIFNRASMVMLDLANVFGSSDAAAKMLGKALSNPIKGVTALQRAGVDFTDQQKQQIKTLVQSGKVLDAQKLILAEVESQVGGTAAAGATGFDRMRVALGNAAEDLGGVLIPYVERFANFVIDKVVPVLEQFSMILGERGVAGAINYLIGSVIRGVWNMGNMGKTITIIIGLFGALKIAVMTFTAVQTGLTIAAQVTTGALNAQIVALNATKVAMLAAGGVTALLTVAASLYAIYAATKSKAVTSTRDFSEALFQEGEAQKNAVVELVKSQRAFEYLAKILNMSGQGLGAFEEYLNKGSGALAQLKGRIDAAAKANRDLIIFNQKGQGFTIPAKDVKVYQKALEDLMSKQKEYKDLQKVLKGLGIDPDPKPLTTLNTTVETAAEKFAKFSNAAKTVTSDQKNLRDALKNTASAQKSLQTATDNVATAQAKLNQIAKGYGVGSKEANSAQEELNKANRDATKAGFDLTKANYAVSDAEEALRRARLRGNPREITEAEIALGEAVIAQTEAQNNVKTSTDAVTDAQTKLNETINGASTSSETYKTALTELEAAQAAQLEAIDKVREAKERELETTRNLAKAEIILRKAKGKLTKKQKAAADKLLAELNTPVTVNVPTPTTVSSVSSSSVGAGFDFSGFDFSGISVGGLATLAQGGIVTKPTFSLIGEGGEPEAVIPLSKMGMMGGDTIINVTVTSADPNAVVDALRRYQRQNGALPLRVQG